jgi:hypothetical protein
MLRKDPLSLFCHGAPSVVVVERPRKSKYMVKVHYAGNFTTPGWGLVLRHYFVRLVQGIGHAGDSLHDDEERTRNNILVLLGACEGLPGASLPYQSRDRSGQTIARRYRFFFNEKTWQAYSET